MVPQHLRRPAVLAGEGRRDGRRKTPKVSLGHVDDRWPRKKEQREDEQTRGDAERDGTLAVRAPYGRHVFFPPRLRRQRGNSSTSSPLTLRLLRSTLHPRSNRCHRRSSLRRIRGSVMSFAIGGLVPFGPDANCTLDLCPLEWSILGYRPSTAASATAIALFALSLAAHAYQGARARTWGFTAGMVSGCILEIIGYAGRIHLYENPFDFGHFLLQIICITLAPVFFCAAIYILLSQLIHAIDESISRFDPKFIYWVFIPCDVVSLVLQAVGGSLSCVAETTDEIQVGVNISLAGLVFQVFTLALFCILFADYLTACWRHADARRKLTSRLVVFLALLFTAVLLILLRCAYRIVELHEGYFSDMFRDEIFFIALESGVICVTVLVLNIGHPGLVLVHNSKQV
ncbi:hypothetical protein RJ55_08655 [Drechmeria coniospora]|nr:hypothetical protein RJ55_08655 [Drechmeria coniospora]